MKFDHILLQNAREKDVDIRERSSVVDVIEEADRVRGVVCTDAQGVWLIQGWPLIADHLAQAHRVEQGPYGEVRVRKDYSYCEEKFWRLGLMLIGDADCFIDPVFSSRVHLATYSAPLASMTGCSGRAPATTSPLSSKPGDDPAVGTMVAATEGPRHRALVGPFALASRPVTNGEYIAFIEAGGYTRSARWSPPPKARAISRFGP